MYFQSQLELFKHVRSIDSLYMREEDFTNLYLKYSVYSHSQSDLILIVKGQYHSKKKTDWI